MDGQIKTISYPNGEIQRVQLVRPDSWQSLAFLHLDYTEGALERFADIYRKYLVPAQPLIFGNMVLFHIPEDMEVPVSYESKKFGSVADKTTAAAAALEAGVRIRSGKPVFSDPAVKELWQELVKRNCLRVVSGKLPVTTIIPVGNRAGYLPR